MSERTTGPYSNSIYDKLMLNGSRAKQTEMREARKELIAEKEDNKRARGLTTRQVMNDPYQKALGKQITTLTNNIRKHRVW